MEKEKENENENEKEKEKEKEKEREKEKDFDVGLRHAKQMWVHEGTSHYIHCILFECESMNVIEMSLLPTIRMVNVTKRHVLIAKLFMHTYSSMELLCLFNFHPSPSLLYEE